MNQTIFLEILSITHNEDTYSWIYNLNNQYSKEVRSRGGTVKVVSEIWHDEGGYEEVILMITEDNAIDYFKEREGKQRLTRVPMFTTQSSTKITGYQTLSIIISIYPEAPNDFELTDISYKAIDLQTGRGMRVSREFYSAEVTHKPTGIVVTCGEERSQIKNKEMAERILKARLFRHQEKNNE